VLLKSGGRRRHVSVTLAPASTSLRIRTIWSSLNFDFFMHSSLVGKLYV
jgi:hypothetical protein